MYAHEHENEVIIFAETNFRNQRQKFGIKTDDRRRHTYILGKSGTGKTTLLENMILEDIYAGHGVAFVDPHGDSSEKLINYIPSHRVNDIVYFNPSDVDFPIGFNILETVDPLHKHLVASGLMGIFKKIWEDQWSARMEYILNNAVLALLDYPGSTLLGINRLLSDKEFRQRVIAQIKDSVVKAFWVKEFAGYQQKFASEAVAPIQNKVGQFLSASIIRNIVAQVKSTIDIRKIMDENKIFIINLSKGRIGEDSSRLLGGMLITKLQLSAMERVDIPEKERCDFYLYVDEFQNFATGSFAEILSEARKYRLNLILAHQYITQIDEKVRDAVFGNVGTHIIFRVGAADSTLLEEEFTPIFTPEDLVNLANHNVYLKLMINGAPSQPFSATTLPPIGSPTDSREKVINVSRERYAQKRTVIEEKINRWWGFGEDGEQNAVPDPREAGNYSGIQRGRSTDDRPPRRDFDSRPPRRDFSEDRPPRRDFDARPSKPAGEEWDSRPPRRDLDARPSRRDFSEDRSSRRDFDSRPQSSTPRSEESASTTGVISDPREAGNYSGIQKSTSYQPQAKSYPVTCSRCGKNVTSRWKPDPKKPYYCEECLAIVKEKIRVQSAGPKSAPDRGVKLPVENHGALPSLPKKAGELVVQKPKSEGISLSSLAPRPPKPDTKSAKEDKKPAPSAQPVAEGKNVEV